VDRPISLPNVNGSSRRSAARSFAALALSATLTIFLAACGGDNPAADDATSAQGSSSAATTLSREALATVSQYTGVKPGKATGSPIKIGFLNADAQELTTAVDEAVRAVNESFGGVRGHPIQLVKCVASSAQQAQQCAQTFVGDPAVVAVIQGTLEVDITAFHAAMSPKVPILGGLPLQPSDAAAPNSYYLSSGQFGALGAVTYVQKYTTAKRISLLSPSGSPANELAITTLQTALEAANIDVTVARFPLDATDMSQAVTQSKASTADLVIPAVGVPQQCVAMANTLQKLSVYTPVLTFAGCLGADVR
jgi:branched-chain amino acid transport system substrate-binding protein